MARVTNLHNDEIINALKDKIQQTFGKQIKTQNDAEALSLDIENKIKDKISSQTIRRFWGLIPNESKTSSTILDIFSKYCNGTNYQNFVAQISDFKIKQLEHFLIKTVERNYIDLLELNIICKAFSKENKVYQLIRNLIPIAYYLKDEYFFKQFYHIDGLYRFTNENQYEIYYTTHLLAVYVRKQEWLQQIAYDHYANLTFEHNYFVEWFVDTDNLDGWYMTLLDKYYQKKNTPESTLFVNEMKFLNAFQLKNTDEMTIRINIINDLKFNPLSIHHIPKSRIIISNILYNGYVKKEISAVLKNRVLAHYNEVNIPNSNDPNELLFFVSLFTQALYWLKEYQYCVDFFENDMSIFSSNKELNHHGNINRNQLLLYYIGCLKELNLPFSNLSNRVNPLLFDSYSIIQLNKDYEEILINN